MKIELDLKQIRKDAENATQGQWTWEFRDDELIAIGAKDEDGYEECIEIIQTDSGVYPPRAADRKHIANMSPENTLALLDRLDRAIEVLTEIINRETKCYIPDLGKAGITLTGSIAFDALKHIEKTCRKNKEI